MKKWKKTHQITGATNYSLFGAFFVKKRKTNETIYATSIYSILFSNTKDGLFEITKANAPTCDSQKNYNN